jgi:hypothetical protein
MNDQDKEYLRDLIAMFAMTGMLMRGSNKLEQIPEAAYEMADHMMEARDPEETVGLPAIKKRTRK